MRGPPAFVHFRSSDAKTRGTHSKRKGTTPFPILGVSAAALRHTRAGLVGLTLAVLFGQGLTLLVAIPVISAIFELILDVSGLSRITDQNLLQVLGDPWAATLLLALTLIAFIAVAVQLAAVAVVANRQQSALVPSIPGATKDLAGALRAMLHFQSPLLMVYVFAIMPLGGFGLMSAITRDIGIPAFISGEMMKAPASFLLYGALIATAFYINLRLVFVFPILAIERTTPWRAITKSIRATHRRSWRILVLVGMIWIAAAVGTAVLVETVTLTAGLLGQLDAAQATPASPSIAYGIGVVGSAVLLNLSMVVIVQALTAVYRRSPAASETAGAQPDSDSAGFHSAGDDSGSADKAGSRKTGIYALAAFVTSAVAVSSLPAVPSAASAELPTGGTAVIAHRGFVGGGVENTISALEAAADVGPDYVEIDVQETKDGRFLLSHDVNLWLVSGKNVNTYELTLEEAVDIKVSVGGFTDRMSSMVEYVKRAEELGVTLLIELKIHGHESPDVVEDFLATLDSIGSTGKHIYHSLNAGVVKELQARRPELTVGRTMAISIGDVTRIAGDFLVVEQTFFTEELAQYARQENKQVFVWTVNDEDAIREYLRMPVDGIVTDKPDVAVRERARIENERGSAAHLRDNLHDFTVF